LPGSGCSDIVAGLVAGSFNPSVSTVFASVASRDARSESSSSVER
jgi:hypothetical protein